MSDLFRFFWSALSASGVLMCPNDGAIEDAADIIVIDAELSKNVTPAVLVRPVTEPVVDRFPRSESLGQVTPRCAGLGDPDDGVDEVAIAFVGLSAVWNRKARAYRPPLFIGQLMTSHPVA